MSTTNTPSYRPHNATRAAVAFVSCSATILFGIVVSHRLSAASYEELSIDNYLDQLHLPGSKPSHHSRNQWAWDVLPIIPSAISTVWNLFCMFVLTKDTHDWLPRRLGLSMELVSGVLLIVLGYLSLIFNVVSTKGSQEWLGMPKVDAALMVVGFVLLNISAITHFVLFWFGTRSTTQEVDVEGANVVVETREVATPPPAYVPGISLNTETTSLPGYEETYDENVDAAFEHEKEKDIRIDFREVRWEHM
ncbi:hypothetical protein AAFC00_001095 [Neodothiora populina]|uniref:Uncharacterized protein n=1 Tax=Neodothiora populina TaxID=2781224 RepID=A0ABR3PMT4_9PEZI